MIATEALQLTRTLDAVLPQQPSLLERTTQRSKRWSARSFSLDAEWGN